MDAHSPLAPPTRRPLHEALLEWRGFPAYIVEKIIDIEYELDQLHPGWRVKDRFDQLQYDTKARVKWLLKRLSLLTHTDGGRPDPLDWDVLIVKDKKNPKQCYAHPVIPVVDSGAETTREPPSPFHTGGYVDRHAALVEFSRPALGSPEVVAPLLAQKMGLSEEQVLADLRAKPKGWMGDDEEWVGVCEQRRTIPAHTITVTIPASDVTTATPVVPRKRPSKGATGKKSTPLTEDSP